MRCAMLCCAAPCLAVLAPAQVGVGQFTLAQQRSHFALWALVKSPLLIGANLEQIPEESLNILKAKEVRTVAGACCMAAGKVAYHLCMTVVSFSLGAVTLGGVTMFVPTDKSQSANCQQTKASPVDKCCCTNLRQHA